MLTYAIAVAAYIVLTGDYPGSTVCLGAQEDSTIVTALLALHWA